MGAGEVLILVEWCLGFGLVRGGLGSLIFGALGFSLWCLVDSCGFGLFFMWFCLGFWDGFC